jgi:hypothetical protein
MRAAFLCTRQEFVGHKAMWTDHHASPEIVQPLTMELRPTSESVSSPPSRRRIDAVQMYVVHSVNLEIVHRLTLWRRAISPSVSLPALRRLMACCC